MVPTNRLFTSGITVPLMAQPCTAPLTVPVLLTFNEIAWLTFNTTFSGWPAGRSVISTLRMPAKSPATMAIFGGTGAGGVVGGVVGAVPLVVAVLFNTPSMLASLAPSSSRKRISIAFAPNCSISTRR